MSDQTLEEKPPNNVASDALIQEEIADAAPIEISDSEPIGPLVVAENKAAEAERLQLENEGLRAELGRASELHDLRKTYTDKLFGLISWWLIIVVYLVILSAFFRPAFTLSDSVLIAFITSTTVTVIGLFIIVAKWLFPAPLADDVKATKDRNG